MYKTKFLLQTDVCHAISGRVKCFFGDIVVALGNLFLKIEMWTGGEIGWGIISCIIGFALIFRSFIAERFVFFRTTSEWS